jgi:hypothetical protein
MWGSALGIRRIPLSKKSPKLQFYLKLRNLFASILKKKTLSLLKNLYQSIIGRLQIYFRHTMFIAALKLKNSWKFLYIP